MSSGRGVEFVLFDIGGVIVQMRDIVTLGPFGDRTTSAEIMAAWLDSPHVDAHERGAIDAPTFARRMVEAHDIAATPEAFLQRCLDWHVGLFSRVETTLAAVDPTVRIACLSNTSAFSWTTAPACIAAARLFERRFLSYEMGMMKPEPAIFRAVATALDADPARIVFFDDTERHVVGARAVGFQAHQVRGIDQARGILERYGLLRGPA